MVSALKMVMSRPVNPDSPLISVLIPTYNAAAYLPFLNRLALAFRPDGHGNQADFPHAWLLLWSA
jgi:hypothetical protein